MASTHRIFRKGGISALASAKYDMSSPSACSLMVKHSEDLGQASVMLRFSLFLRGFDSKQNIQLILDADNLVPCHVKLKAAARNTHITVPQELLSPVLRNQNSLDSLYLFSISLKEHCIVKYPQSKSTTIEPQGSSQEDFAHLAHLAKSTQIYILFDYKWLPSTKSDRLWSIVNYPDRLSGFRVKEESTVAYKQGDWTIFAPGAGDVPPPAYGDISHKRPQQSPTSSPRAPSPKRVLRSFSPLPLSRPETDNKSLLSPTENASTIEQWDLDFVQLSPTEKATTRTSIAPSGRSSPSQGPTAATFTDTVSNAVDSLVPNAVAACLPSLLPSLVKEYVKKLLPELLESTLTPLTSSVASSQHSSPSPPISTCVHTGTTPPARPRPLNQLHRLLHSHITSYSHHLRTVMGDDFEEQIMGQVATIMDNVREEFAEQLDDPRVHIELVTEDGIANLDKHCGTTLDDLTEQTEEIVENAAENLREKVWGYEEKVGESAEKTIEHEGTTVEERNIKNEDTAEDESTTEEEEATAEAFTKVKLWAVTGQSRCRTRTRQRTGIPRVVMKRRAASEPVDM